MPMAAIQAGIVSKGKKLPPSIKSGNRTSVENSPADLRVEQDN